MVAGRLPPLLRLGHPQGLERARLIRGENPLASEVLHKVLHIGLHIGIRNAVKRVKEEKDEEEEEEDRDEKATRSRPL